MVKWRMDLGGESGAHFLKRGLNMTEDELILFEEMRLKLIVIEARLNAIEADRDNDETYRMEQNERH